MMQGCDGTYCLGGRRRSCPDLSIRRSAGMRSYPRVTAITLGYLPHRARDGHATSVDSSWLPSVPPDRRQRDALVLAAISRPASGNPAEPRPGPGPSPEPDSCRTIRQTGSVKGRRSRSRVTPQAPLTGSGCREHSYGGFGGGHPHFYPHADDLRPSSPAGPSPKRRVRG